MYFVSRLKAKTSKKLSNENRAKYNNYTSVFSQLSKPLNILHVPTTKVNRKSILNICKLLHLTLNPHLSAVENSPINKYFLNNYNIERNTNVWKLLQIYQTTMAMKRHQYSIVRMFCMTFAFYKNVLILLLNSKEKCIPLMTGRQMR